MAEKAFLDGEGLQQTVEWLRSKDVGQYTDESKTNEIFNDYSNNKTKGLYNHAEGYNTQAIGEYNHVEGYDTMAGLYKDAYYRYCGNPVLQVPSGTSVINKVAIDSNDYQISGKTGTFSLDSIELPEDFTVGKYSSTLKIFNYNYIFNDNKWYITQITNVETTDELKSLFTILFENNSNINRKIYQVSEEPTEISNNLYIYNGAIYCSAFSDNKITVSEDTISALTTINTLESQTDGYITTIYVNESNYFGFVYYLDNDNLILSKQEYNIDTIYNIDNLTNNYGTFKKIDKVYQSAPTITTQLGLVCGTSFNSTTTPQYSGADGKWEYLNEYNVILSIVESDRKVYDDKGNPTGVVNPSLIVIYNDEILINKTVDFATDTISFIYNKNEEGTFNWYLDGNIVNLAEYGISVENQQEYDIITFELNKIYISYDSEGNQIEKNQEEFYNDNHASGTTSYVFDGTESGNWVKTVKDGVIDSSADSHAEGLHTKAFGVGVHAEGIYTKAIGNGTHTEGLYTETFGNYCHAEGSYTKATGEASHAEGHYTKATGEASHAEGDGSEATGRVSHAEGNSRSTNWYSHAEGGHTIASGDSSHAEGRETQATEQGSHSEGGYTQATNWYSHAEGYYTIASGHYSHAEGTSSEAQQINSHAEGNSTIASGHSSHAEGTETQATEQGSHAEGGSTQATGSYSHAEGNSTIASGTNAHAEGYNTKANNNSDHAEGCNTATSFIPVKYFKNRPIEIPSSKISYLKFKQTYKPVERYDREIISYTDIYSDELTELFTIKDCFGNEQFITNYKVYLSTSASSDLNYRWLIKFGNSYKKCKINWTTAQEYPLDYLPPFCYSNEEKTGVPVFSNYSFILTTDINDFGGYDSGFLLENNNYYSYSANTQQKVLVTSEEVTKFCSLVDKYTGIDLFTNFKNTKEKTTIYFRLSQSVHPDSLLNTSAYGWYFWLNKDENNEVIGLVGAKADVEVYNKISYFYGILVNDFIQNYTTVAVGILTPSDTGYFQSMTSLSSDNEYAYVDDIKSIYFYKDGESYSYKQVQNYTYGNNVTITKDDILNIFNITSSDLETTYYKTSSFVLPSNGTYAHAEGQETNAIARASHAEGQNSSSYGECSHAEGAGSIAYGNVSHAENNGTIAIGACSHTEGSLTKTIGDNAHAEGVYTVAKGFNSHAEGTYTETRGNNSHAEGSYTITKGVQSHAEGYKTYAEGNQSHAEGNESTATGNQSHAEGYKTQATGYQSHAEGNETVSKGLQSHSEGYSTEANGDSSHTEGTFTKANGRQAHAEGCYNEANGECSHAEGVYNKSNGAQSHTEGYGNEIGGNNNHAEGSLNTIENTGNAHAEGAKNIITKFGENSHVEGVENIVNAYNTHIEGIQNTVNKGSLNHVEGYNNIVNNTEIEGANHIGGTSNTSTNSTSSLIHGYKNNSENNNSSLITGSFNDSKGDNQLIAGFGLKEEETPVTSTAILGRYNKDLSDQFEYIEVIETAFIEGKHYFRTDENNEYSEILLLLKYDSSPQYSNYYEFTGDGYIATTDSSVIKGKDYYKLVGDKYLLIRIINDEIDIHPIYEKINKYSFIIGAGQNDTHRTNALELDYQGNLKTSGDIVNGNGVVVGAYISNEKIDEIWDSVFGGGRVCLVQTSS